MLTVSQGPLVGDADPWAAPHAAIDRTPRHSAGSIQGRNSPTVILRYRPGPPRAVEAIIRRAPCHCRDERSRHSATNVHEREPARGFS